MTPSARILTTKTSDEKERSPPLVDPGQVLVVHLDTEIPPVPNRQYLCQGRDGEYFLAWWSGGEWESEEHRLHDSNVTNGFSILPRMPDFTVWAELPKWESDAWNGMEVERPRIGRYLCKIETFDYNFYWRYSTLNPPPDDIKDRYKLEGPVYNDGTVEGSTCATKKHWNRYAILSSHGGLTPFYIEREAFAITMASTVERQFHVLGWMHLPNGCKPDRELWYYSHDGSHLIEMKYDNYGRPIFHEDKNDYNNGETKSFMNDANKAMNSPQLTLF